MKKQHNACFEFREMTEDEKRKTEKKLSNGIPDNMLFLRLDQNGKLKGVTS